MSERSTAPVRVAIVNDYEVIVKGLRTMLSEYPAAVEVVEVEWEGTPNNVVDIVLFDTFASPRSSLNRIERMADDPKSSRVVLYTWDLNDDFTTQALSKPVHAVISKAESSDALVEKLQRVHRGEQVPFEPSGEASELDGLTHREREVLALLASGEQNQAIADELFIGIETVRSHARSIFEKLRVRNRTEAAAKARGLGLVRMVQPGTPSRN